jgi:gas vesicle protein
MSSMLDDTMNTAKNVMDTAKTGTEHAVKSTRSMLLDGFHAATALVTLLRSLDSDAALGWVGLARRTSPLRSLGLFGAGIAVGTGMGMLLAPVSGLETRRAIAKRFLGIEHDAMNAVNTQVKAVEEKAQAVATQASDTFKKVEHQVENKASAGVDAVMQKVDAASAAVKQAAGSAHDDGKTASGRQADPNGRMHHS